MALRLETMHRATRIMAHLQDALNALEEGDQWYVFNVQLEVNGDYVTFDIRDGDVVLDA